MDRNWKHHHYLDELMKNLDQIAESRNHIEWYVKELIWYNPCGQERKMCDIIGGYKDGSAFAWELKGSYVKKPKAIEQLNSAESFLEKMGYTKIHKKLIVYNNFGYTYEKVK